MSTFKEYIFIVTTHEAYPEKAVDLALHLSKGYEKPICFVSYLDKKIKATKADIEGVHQTWMKQLSEHCKEGLESHVLDKKEDFHAFMEKAEASMVIFQLSENIGYNKVLTFLKISRELRVPYIFVKPYFAPVKLDKVLVPVTFLIEDREKGPFSSSLGRFFGSELLMMTAKDYGSKAKQHTNAICTLLDKFKLKYQFIEAEKDSFKVELEAVLRSEKLGAGMVMISASREYGLDDFLFGPKELESINQASVPIMLINPRADLYVLCG
ncbi:MAG: hypothetical protein JXQ69_02985 [Paludibacteraceae bacterium]|nr:hypothetical protein [Paludibacteraceae bacterium]MBN2787268.1 hypothetical protein [Paludibacteraceae bacterium]